MTMTCTFNHRKVDFSLGTCIQIFCKSLNPKKTLCILLQSLAIIYISHSRNFWAFLYYLYNHLRLILSWMIYILHIYNQLHSIEYIVNCYYCRLFSSNILSSSLKKTSCPYIHVQRIVHRTDMNAIWLVVINLLCYGPNLSKKSFTSAVVQKLRIVFF